jgi:Pentapeptide repeats (8 copies)
LHGANLSGLSFSNLADSYPERDLKSVDLRGADLTEANLCGAYISGARLGELIIESSNWHLAEVLIEPYRYERREIPTKLKGANLARACLDNVNLNNLDLSGANLTEASLIETQALGTDFKNATFTGACIQEWNINNTTKLEGVKSDYVYLKLDWSEERKYYLSERRPSNGNFAPGEFTKLFQKAQETVDLIFNNGIDWDAFAYSFKKLEIENQGAQLDVQSIEKKGDGILVVRVAVSPDADKAEIHSKFIQGYEVAAKALEVQYQARLEDKDKVINQLFSSINQLNRQLAETSGKVSIYYQPNSQFAGGIVDAINVNTEQVGGNIQNINNQETPG